MKTALNQDIKEEHKELDQIQNDLIDLLGEEGVITEHKKCAAAEKALFSVDHTILGGVVTR